MWINALQRERAARPIACTTYEDLTSLDLGALKRIRCEWIFPLSMDFWYAALMCGAFGGY